MVQIVSPLLACQVGFSLALAAYSLLVERGGSRLMALWLVAYCGVALTGAVAALGW